MLSWLRDTIGLAAALAASVCTIVAFGITFLSTESLNVALGATALIYFCLIFPGSLIYLLVSRREMTTAFGPFWLFVVSTVLLSLALFMDFLEGDDLRAFGVLQAVAIVLLVGGLVILVSAAVINRPRLQTCPDCAERVKMQARVCRYCGYRFAPPPVIHDEP